jgi:hypothetical protein
MYNTRWPRPGPAMAAVAALLGLVAGAVLGLSSAGPQPRAQASAGTRSSVVATTTTLPEEFHTVILGSFEDRAEAVDRMQGLRRQGVEDAAILDQEEYDLSVEYAVYSGQFESRSEAEAHIEELEGLGVTERFYKLVTRTA